MNKSVILGLIGDLADASISGDLEENGFWSTMGSIVISNVFSRIDEEYIF